jgi:hypothetical protein
MSTIRDRRGVRTSCVPRRVDFPDMANGPVRFPVGFAHYEQNLPAVRRELRVCDLGHGPCASNTVNAQRKNVGKSGREVLSIATPYRYLTVTSILAPDFWVSIHPAAIL